MSEDLNPKDAVGRKKDPIHLIPTEALRIESHAMRYGAYEAKRVDGKQGYGPFNWRETKVSYTIYLDAIARHNMKLLDGEDVDLDSLVHHLGHIRANAGILLDAIKTGSLVDDRPKLSKKQLRLSVLDKLSEEGQSMYEKGDEFVARRVKTVTHDSPESYACSTNNCRCKSEVKDDKTV